MHHVMVLQMSQLENQTQQVETSEIERNSCSIGEMCVVAILHWVQNRLVVAAHLVGSIINQLVL